MMNFEDLKDSEKQEKKNSQNDPLVIITSLVTSCIRYFLQITLIYVNDFKTVKIKINLVVKVKFTIDK